MIHGVLCGLCRLRSDGADGANKGRVNHLAKKKDFSTYLLDKLLAFFVQWWCGGGLRGKLLFGPIGDRSDRKWGMLGFIRRFVLELFEGF